MVSWNGNPNSHWLQGGFLESWCEGVGLPMTEGPPELIWTDLETTGLYSGANVTLEMGLLLTNKFGEVCQDGAIDWLVWRDHFDYRMEYDNLSPVVKEMHTKSSLINDLNRARAKPQSELMDPAMVEADAIQWLQMRTASGVQFPLSGSSAHFDRGFLRADLPRLEEWFHYRVGIDASALRETAKLLNPSVVANQPVPIKKHRPLPDLADSVRLYRHLLQNFLVVNLESM